MKHAKRYTFDISGDQDSVTLYIKEAEEGGLLQGDLLKFILAIKSKAIKIHYCELYMHYLPSQKYLAIHSYTEVLRLTSNILEAKKSLYYSNNVEQDLMCVFSHYTSWTEKNRDDDMDEMLKSWRTTLNA